jgi:hypothetical protein
MGSAYGGWWMKRNGGRNSGGEMGYLKVMRRNGKSINLTVLCSRCAVYDEEVSSDSFSDNSFLRRLRHRRVSRESQ